MTNVNARPMPIHTADSIAASRVSDLVGLPVDDQEVHEQQHEDERQQRQPHPRGDVDVDELRRARRREHRLHASARALTHARHRVSDVPAPMTACAAASRAIGTRNGEQLT